MMKDSQMARHYMVDLETMSTASNAAIVSVGIAEYNETDVLRTFYTNVDLKSCVEAGLAVDPSTIMWWIEQASPARAALMKDSKHLTVALTGLATWLQDDGPSNIIRLWGNGASFDNAILASAYKALNLQQPWPYWGDRCFRTVRGEFALDPADQPPRVGTYHNALDDAVTQIHWHQAILRRYNMRLGS
jgi:hypothetical protein